MRKRIIILIMLAAVVLSGMCGCATSSSNSRFRYQPNDPNAPFEFTGKAADKIADKISTALAQNTQTKEGRLNELVGGLKKPFGWLFLTLVGGIIFWGFTRSRYGWVIPAASLGGMVVIVTFSKLADWIPYIVVAAGIALLIWKATEYQKERNVETLKRK